MKLLYTFNAVKVNDKLTLPVGIKKCLITIEGTGSVTLTEIGLVEFAMERTFPTIQNTSPCEFTVSAVDGDSINVSILVSEIGGLPDKNYFSA